MNKAASNLAVLNSHLFHFFTFREYVAAAGQDIQDWNVVIYYSRSEESFLTCYVDYLISINFINYMMVCVAEQSLNSKWAIIRSTFVVPRLVRRQLGRTTFTQILLCNYNSWSTRLLPNVFSYDKLIYIDEGNSTIDIAEQRRNYSQSASLLNRVLRWLPLFSFPRVATFFTRYRNVSFRPVDEILICRYSHLLQSAGELQDVVIFLGSPLAKVGYVTEENYVEEVMKVNAYYAQRGLSMQYKAHRHEPDRVVALLRARGLSILEDARPIEVVLLAGDIKPTYVASFVTSAFETIALIFDRQINLASFRIHGGRLNGTHVGFEKQYTHYLANTEEMNIEVVPI